MTTLPQIVPQQSMRFEVKKIFHESLKAYCLDVDADEPIWFPKSSVSIGKVDGKLCVDIPQWLCNKHNL